MAHILTKGLCECQRSWPQLRVFVTIYRPITLSFLILIFSLVLKFKGGSKVMLFGDSLKVTLHAILLLGIMWASLCKHIMAAYSTGETRTPRRKCCSKFDDSFHRIDRSFEHELPELIANTFSIQEERKSVLENRSGHSFESDFSKFRMAKNGHSTTYAAFVNSYAMLPREAQISGHGRILGKEVG